MSNKQKDQYYEYVEEGLSSIMAGALNQIIEKFKPKLSEEEVKQGWTINEAGKLSVGRVWTEVL